MKSKLLFFSIVVIHIIAILSAFNFFYKRNKVEDKKKQDYERQVKRAYDDLTKKDADIEAIDLSSISEKKLIFGIFSVAKTEDIRNTLRSTWLTSRYVCPYYQYYKNETRTAEKECVIYYAFVFGNNIIVNEPDAIHLPIKENMNEGKTYEWFKYASQHFMDFEYIGKGDQVCLFCQCVSLIQFDDTFINLIYLLCFILIRTHMCTQKNW